MENRFPRVEHRYCVRHMYANFKLQFKDKQLGNIMWATARAYMPDRFEASMGELQAISPEAHALLRAVSTNLWARHSSTSRIKCDLQYMREFQSISIC